MKLKKLENYMKIAEVVSESSHDEDTKVGSILIDGESGAILSTGYNGFIRSAPDEKLPKTRPDKYQYIIHAEQNLICNASRHGISMDGGILICTMSPCIHCIRLLYQCGIKEIYCKELYKDFQDNINMLDLQISFTSIYKYYKIDIKSKS